MGGRIGSASEYTNYDDKFTYDDGYKVGGNTNTYGANQYGGDTYGTYNGKTNFNTYGKDSIFNKNNKIPSATEYAQNLNDESLRLDNETKSYDLAQRKKSDNSFFGNKSTMNKIQLGIGITKDVLNTWNNFQQLDLQKKEFEFNKKMATKEFALAKDAYDRKVRRGDSIARQMK
jgi:hypothetical protein